MSGNTLHCLDAVAQHLLRAHPAPDLRHVTVLLPNYHVAQPLAQRLAALSGAPVLLPPRLTTFTDWVNEVSLPQAVVPDSARLAALYQALRRQGWFEQADRWALAGELLTLMDELTREHIALPQDEAEFLAQLEQAYQARSNRALQFEARVVHELWRAMSASGGLDAVAAYQQRLAHLANEARAPLYVLITSELATPERRFLQAYAERAEVKVFEAVSPTGEEITEETSSTNPLTTPDLRLPTDFSLFPAHGIEQEAQAADVQIRRWLLAGRRRIAVVAQDRLVARRVRALLERAGILVQDETGWTFATLAVSTVLMRWLEAVQGDFYYQDVLDLMKSPYVFADQPAAERKQAVYQLERLLREHQVAARLEEFQRLAESEVLRHALLRLQQAAQRLPIGREFTLGGWLERLEQSLDSLGVLPCWAQDAAGRELLLRLAQWREELADDRSRFSFGEWRRWLAQQLDENTFRDTSVESPVVFTHLAGTRWRRFDAVLLLGCDADHLPGKAAGQWFNDAVRGALGLPVSADKLRQIRADLDALLALNDTVLVTWQASKNGEPNLLSPWLEQMRAQHQLAGGADLLDQELATLLEAAQVRPPQAPLPPPLAMPQPAAPVALLPQRISPSGYNALVACPYQYFARRILRLDELDEVRETLDKRDYGTWVHAILQRFHGEFPQLCGVPRAELEAALTRLSDEVFAEAIRHDFLAHGWRLRWQAQQSGYLDWQLASEQAGWQFAAAEQDVSLPLSGLQLHGRLDRLDRHADGAQRVLDYKTKDKASLSNLLKQPGEDVQLASYVAMSRAAEAAFVALDDSKTGVTAVQPEQDMADLAALNLARLEQIFEQLRKGAPLPANGIDRACGYCPVRGLCRKGQWER
jgi:ATP-dependent helicase/nuclease subunit B